MAEIEKQDTTLLELYQAEKAQSFEKQKRIDELGFIDIMSDSVIKNSGIGATVNALSQPGSRLVRPFDEKSFWEDNLVDETISPRWHDYIKDARNQDAAEERLAQAKRGTTVEEWGEDNPFKSFAAGVGGAMVDVPLFGKISKATQVVAPSFYLARNAKAYDRFKTNASLELAFTGLLDSIGPEDQEAMDYILNPLLVGSIGSAIKDSSVLTQAAEHAIVRRLDLNSLDKDLAKAATEEEKKDIIKKHKQKIMNSTEKDILEKTEKDSLLWDAYKKLDFSVREFTKNSKSATMNVLSRQGFVDRALRDNELDAQSADERGTSLEERINGIFEVNLKKDMMELGDLIHKDSGIAAKAWKTSRWGDLSDQFNKVIGQVQLRRTLGKLTDEQAIKELELNLGSLTKGQDTSAIAKSVFASLNKSNDDIHKLLSDSGKRGFEADGGIAADQNYFPIMYNQNMAQNFKDMNLGFKDFKEFIHGSLISNVKVDGRELSEETVEQIQAMADALSSAVWKNQESYNAPNSSFDDLMKQALRDNDASDEVFEMFFGSTPTRPGAKASPYTETRSPFDYGYEHIFTANGKEVKIGFEDIVQSNYQSVMQKYSRKQGGALTRENVKFKMPKDRQPLKDLFKETRVFIRDAINALDSAAGSVERDTGKTIQDISQMSQREVEELIAKYPKKGELVTKIRESNIDAYIDTKVKALRDALGEDVKDQDVRDLVEETIAYLKGAAREIHLDIKEAQKMGAKIEDKNEEFLKRLEAKMSQDKFDDNLNAKLDKLSEEEIDLSTDANIDRVRKAINTELREAGSSDKEINAELSRFDDIVKEWKGVPTASDPDGYATQAMRTMKNFNIARLLGQTGFTMAFEGGGIAFHTGLKNFMEFSSMKKLVNQLKTGETDDQLMQEIQTHFGLGNELLKDIGGNAYDHNYNVFDQNGGNFMDAAESLSRKFSEATLIAGGVKPLTAFLEVTMAKDTINNLTIEFMKKNLSRETRASMKELGVSEDMVGRIWEQFKLHGTDEPKKWTNGTKVKSLNFENWSDIEAKEALIFATRRITNTMVQKSRLGDKLGATYNKGLFKNSIFGQAALELKSYMITAYSAQLGRALNRSDAYTAGLLMSQIAAGSMGIAAQNFMNYAGNQDKLEESFEPVNFARSVVGKLPGSSYLPMLSDTVSGALMDEKLFSSNRYHSSLQSGIMSMPTIDGLSKLIDMVGIAPDMAKNFYNDEDIINKSHINTMFGIAPMGNSIFARPFSEAWKSSLD